MREDERPEIEASRGGSPEALGAALAGTLPCVRCGYELRGLTVRGVCPECSTPIRVTILYAVDPNADAFREIPRGSLMGGVLVGVMGSLTGAIVLAWLSLIGTALARTLVWAWGSEIARWSASGVIILVGMASALMLFLMGATNPDRPVQRAGVVLAVAGGLLLAVCGAVVVVPDAMGLRPGVAYFGSDVSVDRVIGRIGSAVAVLMILFGLRPLLLELHERSALLRTGKKGRQRHNAVLGAVAVSVAGDLLRLVSTRMSSGGTLLEATGSLAALVGSGLLALGLAGLLWNALQIRDALAHPPRTLGQLTAARSGPIAAATSAGSRGGSAGG